MKLNITLVNWARALKSAQFGAIEAIYPTLYSKQRAEFLDFSLPAIGEVTLSLYGLNNNDGSKQRKSFLLRSLLKERK